MCPPGVGEGDLIAVTVGATVYHVKVPCGVTEHESFVVQLPSEEDAALPALGSIADSLEARGEPSAAPDVLESALNAVIDAIEDHDNTELDDLVDGNCAEFARYDGGEAKLE